MSERTAVRLPPDLLNRAKRKAVAEGRTLTAPIEEGLRHVVAQKRVSARVKRVLPAVGKATGGLFRHPSPLEEAFGFCDILLAQPHCRIVELGERH